MFEGFFFIICFILRVFGKSGVRVRFLFRDVVLLGREERVGLSL